MARNIAALALMACVSTTILWGAQTPPANVSGAWAGTIRIPDSARRGEKSALYATFRQMGTELTGTIGPAADSRIPITKGRVETTKFGTVVTFDMPLPNAVMSFELRPWDGALRGIARLTGEKATAPVELLLLK